jgi:hypothetical protein
VGMRLNYPLDATERCQPHSASEFALQEASHNKTIVNIMLLVNFERTGDTHTPSVQYVASAHLQQAHWECTSSSSTLGVHTFPKMTTTTKRFMISKPGLKRAIITLPRTIVIFLTHRQHRFQTSAVPYQDHHAFHLPLHKRTMRLPLAMSNQVVLCPLTRPLKQTTHLAPAMSKQVVLHQLIRPLKQITHLAPAMSKQVVLHQLIRPLKQTMHLPLAVSTQLVLCPLTRPLKQTTHLAPAMSKQVVLHQLIRPLKQTMHLPLAVSTQLVPRPLIRPPKPLDFDLA